MSKSIKLNDNQFIDATGVYDTTFNKTQQQINYAAVRCVHYTTDVPYICSIPNLNVSPLIKIHANNREQFFIIMGSGSQETYYLTQLVASYGTHHYGNSITCSYDTSTLVHELTPGSWFRGIIMSYDSFSVSVEYPSQD